MLLSITIAKTGDTYTRDSSKLPVASQEYLTSNGWSQRMRDCHASIQRKNYADGKEGDEAFLAEVRAANEEVLRQLDTGDVPGTRAPVDPRASQIRAATKDMDADQFAKVLAFIEKQTKKVDGVKHA